MSELESMSSISENEDIPICPLCYNELDATDQSLLPCPCNFQVFWWVFEWIIDLSVVFKTTYGYKQTLSKLSQTI